MKRLLFMVLLTLAGFGNAAAQYDEGTKFLGATFNEFDLSYSNEHELSIEMGVNAGYFVMDKMLLIGFVNLEYEYSKLNEFEFGAKMRYFLWDSDFFVGAGAKFVHANTNFNDFMVTPEIGYSYFITDNLAIQPSIYYDLSSTDFKNRNRFGLSIGLGFHF